MLRCGYSNEDVWCMGTIHRRLAILSIGGLVRRPERMQEEIAFETLWMPGIKVERSESISRILKPIPLPKISRNIV